MTFVSPGAYFREIDFSLYVPNLSTTICGMVGTATEGPVDTPTWITNVPQFIRTFGNPSPSHYMPYAALEYLRRGQQLIVVRISGTTATTAVATFNAFKPGYISSTDSDNSYTIGSSTNNLRVTVVDSRTDPVTTLDATVTLTAGTYATAALMAAEIANKLKRNQTLTDAVTAIVYNGKLTIVALTASTLVSVQVQAASTNSAVAALTIAATVVPGVSAGSFQLQASSVGSHGNFISVQMIPKPNFTFDLAVFEGTPLNSTGYRTELFQGLKLDDSVSQWVGTVVGSDITAGGSLSLQFVTVTPDTIASAETLIVPERALTTLVGGDDGLTSVISADYIGISSPTKTGLQIFADPDAIDVNILCVPGITAPEVLNELLAVCENRGDAIGILDTPDNYTPQQVTDWHNGAGIFAEHQAFDSSYGAMYYPWVQIYDAYNGVNVWTPPCGHVAAVYAYTDYIAETWFAPAGFNRAHLVSAQSVRYNADHGEREFMYGDQNAINPIVQFPKDGITIWGQRTLQRAPTARDRVNVRRLLLYLRKVIATAVKYLIFEPDDPATWRQFVRLVQPFMASVQSRRGVYAFSIVCDETTNPAQQIDNNVMGARVYLQPTKAAEVLNVDFVLTPTGAKFSDYSELIF